MDTREFVPAEHAAERLGVPAVWLKRQAKRGEIPSIEAGVRRLFNVNQVRDALLRRANERRQSVEAA